MKRLFILAMSLLLVLLAAACGGEDVSTPAGESIPGADVSDSSAPTGTTTGDTPASGNEMDGADWFDTTTTTADATATATSTTLTTTTATTVAPPQLEEQGSVSLPATGYDPDGKGRLIVGAVSLRDRTVSLEIQNVTTGWMTEETGYYEYTCYDKAGKVLTLADEIFGKIYIGQIRAGQSKTFTFTIPEGTRRVEITGYDIRYWTEWS